jgi:NADH dehydrogenase
LAGPIEAAPYTFDEPERLARVMEGVTTFYNTYWVRFERGRASFAQAVRNSRTLFQAAREAGVRRIVHISIAKADAAPTLPYYRGKAQAERELASVGVASCMAMATSWSTTWRGCSGGSRSSRSPARAATASALFM